MRPNGDIKQNLNKSCYSEAARHVQNSWRGTGFILHSSNCCQYGLLLSYAGAPPQKGMTCTQLPLHLSTIPWSLNFEIFTTMAFHNMDLHVMTLCIYTEDWGICPKYWYTCTRLHGGITLKITAWPRNNNLTRLLHTLQDLCFSWQWLLRLQCSGI